LTTKCSIMMPVDGRNSYPLKYYDSSAKHIKDSVDLSLQKLGVDQIEYLLLHRPDYWLNADEVSETINTLKSAGKVRHFGVSNYTRSQMSYLQSKIELDVNQMEISVSHPHAFEDGSLDYCKEKSIAITAWSPLGGGKIFEPNPDKRTKRIKKQVKKLAKKYDCQEDQILISWLSTHPAGIVPVLGTSKIKRIKSALKATAIKMERTDWYALLEASLGHEVA
ncbi:MAG: aldo/keto reductase, partial [Saprospiraceae bacterium]